MNRAALLLNALMLSALAGGCDRGAAARQPNAEPPWPSIPKTGFISGRIATQADLDAGNAVFVSSAGGQQIGKALDIEVPQFAVFHDAESDQRTRVIIVQAEEANGTMLVGYREVGTGITGLATLPEFELLGRQVKGK